MSRRLPERDPLLDQTAGDVGEEHQRDELGDDLADQRRVRPLERVEQRLRLLQPEQLVAVAAEKRQHLVAEARAGHAPVFAGDLAAREGDLVEPDDERPVDETASPHAQPHRRQRQPELGEQPLAQSRHDLGREAVEVGAELGRHFDRHGRQQRRQHGLVDGRSPRRACTHGRRPTRPCRERPGRRRRGAQQLPGDRAQNERQRQERHRRQPRNNRQQRQEPGRDGERLRLRHDLQSDVAPELAPLLLRRHPRDDDARRTSR